ncbi:ABC transporter permease [Wenzhouxiangella marina]|uniref:Transport permease protein n=1 Tax=Wenzhouxiangella marina TaxID=1579979 RepID=A0A0K0XT36_9GAMM|nr:ABC transporter permease [Wenzhouxiangella marina]AKS40879.1 hypothetical protein WM2015_497 [Wenzhouxiangella marina]MBB6087753.1 ABC-type polysaccharide/polyol phosphate export permease [Wenzhouxiangella marina]
MAMKSEQWVFLTLVQRELRNRFIGSATGWLWLILTPLMMLAVYAFVFSVIFRARVPEGLGVPFWSWLAIALWPWLAFSESIQRSLGAIRSNAALLTKVSIDRRLFVTSSVSSTFLLHVVGYLIVLLAIQCFGARLDWLSLPYVLALLLSLYLFALGLSFICASSQVFIRDIEQFVPTFLMLWFFLTPIIYASEMIPQLMRDWLWVNPMTVWMESFREALFIGKRLPDLALLMLFLGAGSVYLLGRVIFDRLAPSFEDFL